MRPFDPTLLEILKTEIPYETSLRTDPQTLAQFMRETQADSGSSHPYAPLKDNVSIGRLVRYAPWPAHRTFLLEMNYVVNGSMRVHVGNQEILIRQGDFFLPNQYTDVARDALGEDDIVVAFIMKPQFLEEACIRMKTTTILSEFMLDTLRRDISWNRYLHFSNLNDIAVQNLAETIIYAAFPYLDDSNITCGVSPDPEITAAVTSALFVALSRNLVALDETSPTNFDVFIRQAVTNYIASNYKTASLRDLAGQVNQSESALSRQIKAIFGFTFKDLLLQKRFERAVVLLQQTNLSVADVAEAVGYENTSFFYRRFRTIYGISPKDYRNQ